MRVNAASEGLAYSAENTAVRYIDTLMALPVGRWKTTSEVMQELRSKGYQITTNTLRRDILRLSGRFGIESRKSGYRNGAAWKRTALIVESSQ